MNYRVTVNHSDASGYKAEVRRFERWEDAALWFGHLLAKDEGFPLMISREETGLILVQTTEDYKTLGVRR